MRKKGKPIFALDIGTRSIVGILMEETKEGIITIKDIVIEEHSNRAMLDGQIHNIPQVSSLVKEVKNKLEKNSKKRLKNVAVAAAGRSLKTVKTKIFFQFNNQEVINSEDVLKLELKGAQKAQSILLDNFKEKVSNYYCVGYSITKYFLDGDEIGSLVGQKGDNIGLEIVAAFLPKVVVDSLQSVLEANGLELASITLEPIAAINAILPPTMRKLNLALVDVGAGTSDIAISSDGSITAYGMVPIAGDEITEALCEKYLLDFNDGEKVKRQLTANENKNIIFTDILGFEHSLEISEIVTGITQTIENLAKKVAGEILNLNTKPPQAVILIGGGSLTPLLTKYLADLLGLPEQRVAVQKAASIKEINNLSEEFTGPEFITPLGIGLTALKYITLGFIPVKVNNQSINLLNLGKNTVLDALLAAGIDTGKLYGKPGLALTVEVNGKLKTFPGTMGEKAIIKINGKEVSLDTLLKPKDSIQFIKAKDGKPGKGNISQLLPPANYVKINGESKELPFEVTMNGKMVSLTTELVDGSKISFREINQLGELLEYWKAEQIVKNINITLIIDGETQNIILSLLEIKRNGQEINLYETLQPEDEVTINERAFPYTVKDILDFKNISKVSTHDLQISVNGKKMQFSGTQLEIKINDQIVDITQTVNDGDIIEINSKEKEDPILVDIFPKIDFAINPPPNKTRLEMLINGKEAEYTTPLKNGDKITLQWK